MSLGRAARSLVVALAAVAFEVGPTAAQGAARRGPLPLRDESLLAQPRLTLPALGPDTLEPGRSELSLWLLWSNTFAWTQDVPGETPADRRFLVDGEALTLDLGYARGFGPGLDLAVRLPLRRRGGGVLDALVDAFHRAFAFAGVGDGGRPAFRRDAFRVEGRTRDGRAFSWNDAAGSGLGDLELAARRRFLRRAGGRSSAALVGRLSLPTGSGPFAGGGVAAGAQLVAAHALSPRADLYLGLGGTLGGTRRLRGVGYERVRGHAFAALEFRPGRRVSLLVESDAATRLVSDADRFPGTHWLVSAAARLDLARRLRLDLGLVENVKDQQATADLALHAGLTLRR